MDKQLKIAITGKMRSGKDTFSRHFVGFDYFYPIKFSKGIKEVIDGYLPDVAAQPKNREAYQIIGQSMRQIDPLVWVKYSISCAPDNEDLIVTDLRQGNEAEFLRQIGFIIIKVEADEEVRIERMEKAGDTFSLDQLNHQTELSVDRIKADYIIQNNGREFDLMLAAQNLKKNYWKNQHTN